MASLIFMSFSMPLCASKSSIQELQMKKADTAAFPSQATAGAETKFLASCSPNRELSSMRQGINDCLTSPLDCFGEHVSCLMNVSSCTHKKMIGYWVGPDFDDGCGFVEAFVDQIT